MKRFFSCWVAGGLLLYYFGPIEWSGSASPAVALYVLLCWSFFLIGSWASRHSTGVPKRFVWQPQSRRTARAVMSLHAGLTLFYLFATTGRNAFSASDYSLDFGQVYSQYGEFSSALDIGPVAALLILLKAAVFPIALLLFIEYFKTDRIVVALFVGPLLVSSLFRGTDKEIVDLLVLLAVAAFLHGMLTPRRIFLGAGLIVAALSVFFLRRVGRFEGEVPSCLPDSDTCFNYDSFVSEQFGRSAEMLSVFLTHYMTNGYQGLYLSFDLPWQPNFGVGHLPPLKETLCAWVGQACAASDYQEALTAHGWDARARWTSVYPVIANDVSFWLVPIYLLILGLAFQRAMNAWRLTKDPASGATLAVIAMFVIYSSANMQVAISIDWTFATILFLYVAPWRKLRAASPQAADPSMSRVGRVS